jgi:NADH dehydrogenase FAD-containing subunit
MASAEKIDVEKKQVLCKSAFDGDEPFALPYDKLVIAVGCDVNTYCLTDEVLM